MTSSASILHPLRVLGHRGAKAHAPENSLLGIRRGFELGADWVELDVQTVDGEPVLFHDRRLERMTGRTGVVPNTPLEQLLEFGVGEGEKVPRLRDALHMIPEGRGICLEIKDRRSVTSISNLLGSELSTGTLSLDRVIVSCFDHRELLKLKKQAPKIPRALLLYGVPLNAVSQARDVGATEVHIDFASLDGQLVAEIHNAKLKLIVYTVNEVDDIQEAINLKVDGIISDFPDRVALIRSTSL